MNIEIRKLGKIGKRSYGIVLPMNFVKGLKWREKQKLTLELKRNAIVIKDWSKPNKKPNNFSKGKK